MSDPYHNENESDPYRNDRPLDRPVDRGQNNTAMWATLAILGLLLAGGIVFFTSDRTNNVANNSKQDTSTTGTRPMNPPPSNPGTGSGAPQGSPTTPSTTGNAPAR